MKRRMRKLAGLFLTLAMVLGLAFNVSATTSEDISDAQQKADDLEEQKNAAEAKKDTLAGQLETILADIKDTEAKLEDKKSEVEEVENELAQAKIDANNQYESMKVRIKYMYESGGNQLVEVLMESKNMGDFLNKAEYVSQISEYDRNELARLCSA